MKNSSKSNAYFLEITLILILGLIPLLWYKDGFIGLGHDMGFPLAPIDHFKDKLFIWTDRLGPFGSNQVQVLGGIFLHGLEAFFSYLGFSLQAVQQITYIIWFVLPGLTMYMLLRSLHPQKEDYPIRLSGSLFYMMNHYLLQGWTIAERTKFSIVAAMPLVILIIINVIHNKGSAVKNSILLTLTLFFLNGGNGVPLWGGLSVAVLTITVTLLFLSKEKFIPKLKRTLLFSLLSTVFLLLLNAYWIFPLLKSYNQMFVGWVDSGYGIAGIIAWSQGVSANTSWIELFKLRGIPEWYGNLEHPYANEFFSNPGLIFINLLLPSMALAGLLRLKHLKGELFNVRISFLIMLLVAIPLSAGSHTPLGGLYDFALGNIPGFAMFRSAIFKFGMVIWFAYAYLIAVGFKDVIDWIKDKVFVEIGRLVPGTLITGYIVAIIIYNYPLLNGEFFNYSKDHSTRVQVPDYVFAAQKEIDKEHFSTRTLYMPNADLRTKYMDYTWGFFSLEVLQHLLGRNSSVINGFLASPQEIDLITAIYQQYSLFGSSDLVRFIGVDKVVLQNDFISPDYMENPFTNIKDVFKKSDDFTFTRSFDKWELYKYSKESLPLIYSPEKINFFSALSSDLPLITKLPDETSDSDAVYWSDNNEQSNLIGKELFNRYVIEATCADCPTVESYLIYPAPSRLLIPGSNLYAVNRFIEYIRWNLTGTPASKIDFILDNSATLVGNTGLLAQRKEEARAIGVAVNDLNINVQEIKINLEKISNPKQREASAKKVRYFLNYFVRNISQWKNASGSKEIAANLTNLESILRSQIEESERKISPKRKIEADQELFKYSLNVPKDGTYNIYLYWPTLPKNWETISINGQSISMQKINQDWFGISSLPLQESTTDLEIFRPVYTNYKAAQATDFNLTANPQGLSCKQLQLNDLLRSNGKKLDSRFSYKITYRHNQDSNKLKLQLIEENKTLKVDDVIRGVYPKTVLITEQPRIFETTAEYIPSYSAEDLAMNLCLDPSAEPLSIDFSHFNIYSIPAKPVIFASMNNDVKNTSPSVEFVALNQTKYLVKIKDVKDNFILNLNSRFDSRWSLREVNLTIAEKYFTGKRKDYLGGKVVEYERRDDHIITDMIFAKSNQKFVPEFSLNGFSNGFVIDSEIKDEEKIYLLEYSSQNDFYIFAGVSIVSFMLVSLFYLFRYAKLKV